MKLGSWNTRGEKLISSIYRDLSKEELKLHKEYSPLYVKARNRFCLFRLLNLNYSAWRNYLKDLLSAHHRDQDNETDELNRLILNYLTTAYTIWEHFKGGFRKRRDGSHKQLANFLDKLCSSCTSFAFVWDLRNYVQHKGLAIEYYRRSLTNTSVCIELTLNYQTLASEKYDLKLKGNYKNFDLVTTLEEFHIQMHQSYGAYVANAFYPELKQAAEFYNKLTEEIKKTNPFAKMVLFEEIKTTPQGDGTSPLSLQYISVPNDLYQELGIQVKPRTQ